MLHARTRMDLSSVTVTKDSLVMEQYAAVSTTIFLFFTNKLNRVSIGMDILTVLILFSDHDECTSMNHTCHANATCSNTIGSHNCTCNEGFYGDGNNCTGIESFITLT